MTTVIEEIATGGRCPDATHDAPALRRIQKVAGHPCRDSQTSFAGSRTASPDAVGHSSRDHQTPTANGVGDVGHQAGDSLQIPAGNPDAVANADLEPPFGHCDGVGDGLDKRATQAKPAISDAVLIIRGHQRKRVATMRIQHRIANQVGALVRSGLGWSPILPKNERDRIGKTAAKIIKSVEKGKAVADEHLALAADLAPFILAAAASRAPFDDLRDRLTKVMTETAATLPVAEWVIGIRGVGLLGLAVIVGEAGNLSDYANPSRLRKRLGLAPPDCYRMTCKDGSEANAIPRRRRSAIWTIGASLIKGNRGGPFKKLYDDRKAYERQRDPSMSKLHAHRRAQRYMEQRLIRDLWRAWRDADLVARIADSRARNAAVEASAGCSVPDEIETCS